MNRTGKVLVCVVIGILLMFAAYRVATRPSEPEPTKRARYSSEMFDDLLAQAKKDPERYKVIAAAFVGVHIRVVTDFLDIDDNHVIKCVIPKGSTVELEKVGTLNENSIRLMFPVHDYSASGYPLCDPGHRVTESFAMVLRLVQNDWWSAENEASEATYRYGRAVQPLVESRK